MKVLSILSVAVLAASVPAFAQETGTLKKLRDTGEIVLGVRDASIPFSYADETGKSIGYSVDLCKSVATAVQQQLKLQKLDVKWVPVWRTTCPCLPGCSTPWRSCAGPGSLRPKGGTPSDGCGRI